MGIHTILRFQNALTALLVQPATPSLAVRRAVDYMMFNNGPVERDEPPAVDATAKSLCQSFSIIFILSVYQLEARG